MKTGSFTRVVALAVFAALTGTACGGSSTSGTPAKTGAPYQVAFSSGSFTLNSKIANKIAAKQALNFAISIEGTGIPIFGAAMSGGWQRGVDGVKSKYGAAVNGQVIGPINTDVPAQVSQINSLLAAGQIDCLAFEAHEPGPYVDVINKAMKSGIPVFGVNADSPDSNRIAFYGPDELVGGTVAGTAAGKWAKANNVTWTSAAVMTGSVEGPWAQNRMKGFITGIQAELPSLQFVNSPSQGIESQGFAQPTVYAKAKAYIAGHPNVQIIFHTDQGVEMVAKAINDLGLKGKMRTAGYNISPAIADYIKSGIIVVTMVQGFSRQAEAGAKACGDFLYGGKYSTGNVVISPDPVTPDNVASKDWTDPANQ